MRFADIKGNDAVKKALVGMVDSGKVPHAIMFNEEDGGGAFPICVAFLQYLFYGDEENSKISKFIHPDIHFVYPIQAHDKDISVTHISAFRELASANPYFKEQDLTDKIGAGGKQTGINVNEANYICDKLAFNSLEGSYKAVVMYLPEKMNTTAANKLLKSLEEPSEKTIFLLITHYPERVLKTIDSRCLHMRVFPEGLPEAAQGEGVEQFKELFLSLMQALTERDLLAALEVGESIAALPSRDVMKAFCAYGAGQLRDLFLCQQGVESIAGAGMMAPFASKCRKSFPRVALGVFDKASMLVDRNVSPKIVFTDMVDRMFISI